MVGLEVLLRARAAGLSVVADGGRLVVKGPKSASDLAREVLSHKLEVLPLVQAEEEEAEVRWRVDAMRPQVPRTGPIPLLVAQDGSGSERGCLSCGGTLDGDNQYRCRWCARAARLVLDELREGVQA